LEVPLQGLAQDYAQVLNDFGDKIPGAIRSKFAALGLDPLNPSNQKQLFTLENANALLQNINEHVGGDRATNLALGKLRDAVKGAVLATDSSGGPFAPAVRAAAERFKLQDAVPALKAASDGTVAPDDFVRRFVVNGKTDEVKGLADILKQTDPTAWQEARAQIADTLKRAAFGENVAGDAPFSPSRYMGQVRRLGADKLRAFFSPPEVEDILRVGRVGAYINQAPNASVVNNSGTAAAVANLVMRGGAGASRIPGVNLAVDIGRHAVGAAQRRGAVRNALAAIVPETKAPLSSEQMNALAQLLATGEAGGAEAGNSARRRYREERAGGIQR
jgi:hypothetical protein